MGTEGTEPPPSVVETDGWRYHRTPARQAKDNRRMRQHALAGRTAVRFSHYEIRHEPESVERSLAALVSRLISGHGRAA